MKKSIFKRWWFWVIVVIVVGGIGSSLNKQPKKVGENTTTDNKVSKVDSVAAKKEETKEEKNEEKKEETKEEKKEEKVYKVGDIININDKYEITINKATLTKERNQFHEQKVEKVAVIEYTYKNVNTDKDLFVSELNFKVYDEEGNALETYPAGVNKHPQEIAKGKKCTAEMSYGFNKGNKLELHFYDNMFNSKSDFKILVDAK